MNNRLDLSNHLSILKQYIIIEYPSHTYVHHLTWIYIHTFKKYLLYFEYFHEEFNTNVLPSKQLSYRPNSILSKSRCIAISSFKYYFKISSLLQNIIAINFSVSRSKPGSIIVFTVRKNVTSNINFFVILYFTTLYDLQLTNVM